MKLLLTLTALLPLVASSLSHGHDPRDQNLQASPRRSRQSATQADLNAYNTPDYSSSNLNPLSPTSISSLDDDIYSEVLVYITTWTSCSRRYLDCKKCPHDRRCRHHGLRPIFLSSPTSSAKPSPTPIYRPRPRPYVAPDPGDPEALTGPQLKPLPELVPQEAESGDGNGDTGCQLSKCGKMVNACGKGATCVGWYCACASGLKSSSAGTMGRGWDVPESATVYVNVGVTCDQSCDEMFCTEVGGLEGCFGGAVGKNEVETTNSTGHGAIQVPGAGAIDGDGSPSVSAGGIGSV